MCLKIVAPQMAIFMGIIMKHDEAMEQLDTGTPGYPISRQLEHVVTHVHQIQFGPCWNDADV